MFMLCRISAPRKYGPVLCRTLFSQNNQWDQKLTINLKLDIEKAWTGKCHQTSGKITDKSKKVYVLSMFPYPSGRLHMGHVRVYTISDVMARFYRMQGKQVIHPMGWDAFGLPAENAAIEKGIPPKDWTVSNIAYMRDQLKKMSCTFDWDRELATCNPDYYRWTQYIFIKLWEAGLAYQRESPVNWDPVDQTVLADEQVDENGCSWRSGAKVQKRRLKQWFVKTSAFAKPLLDGLSDVNKDDWKDIIKMQKHWIGKCTGNSFAFEILDGDTVVDTMQLWTDRAEYLNDTKFVAFKSAESLQGLKTEGLRARNPVNGDILPVFVSSQLLYPEGAETLLGIPCDADARKPEASKHLVTSYEFCLNEGLDTSIQDLNESERALKKEEVIRQANKEGFGGYTTSPRLRDWLISRQRYWGTPIPVIHCTNCGSLPVPVDQLPVQLPEVTGFSKKGNSILKELPEWYNTECHKCGGPAVRETDTMDTFVDSSWYFVRYLDNRNEDELVSKDISDICMPVDLYIGGKEHATLHLFYARFINHFLHSLGLVPTKEPFKRLLVQGMVKGQSYRLKDSGKYLKSDEVITDGDVVTEKSTGAPVGISWEKMSKSKHNGVEPEHVFDKYGIDTSRLLILANVPPRGDRNWSEETTPGVLNWQSRVWTVVTNFRKSTESSLLTTTSVVDSSRVAICKSRDMAVKGVNYHMENTYFLSAAISVLQGFTNDLMKIFPEVASKSPELEDALSSLIIMLYPYTPHFAAELWVGFTKAIKKQSELTRSRGLDFSKAVWEQPWPELREKTRFEVLIKVDGLVRGEVNISADSFDEIPAQQLFAKAGKDKKIAKSWKEKEVVQCEVTRTDDGNIYLNVVTK